MKKIPDIFFRTYRIIGRFFIKYSFNPRPSSHPYVTGDGFRNFADHIYDNFCKYFDPNKVKDRDIVFVGDSNIKKFLTKIHPKIKSKYILITHNGDEVIDQEALNLVDQKVLKWYGINVLVSDKKVVPIPLGIENKHYYVLGIPALFRKVVSKKIPKKNFIFYGFSVITNIKERQEALDVLKENRLTCTSQKWLNFYSYLHLLATYKFVASPPGSCVEGHRAWEAMYVDVIPIVKSSITIDYFEKIGVPLWSVKDWRELESLTEKDLEEKFNCIKKRSNMVTIYMDYWMDKIKNIKD